MIDVFVYHGEGNTQAQDIVNILSSAISAATALGQKFLADNYGLQTVHMVCAANMGYAPGVLVEVIDGRQGVVWYGMITDVSHSIRTDGNSPIYESELDVLKNRNPP